MLVQEGFFCLVLAAISFFFPASVYLWNLMHRVAKEPFLSVSKQVHDWLDLKMKHIIVLSLWESASDALIFMF